jgi:hypothetical protein
MATYLRDVGALAKDWFGPKNDSLEGYPTEEDSLERLSYERLSHGGIPSGMLASWIVP